MRKPGRREWTAGDTVRVKVRFAGPVQYTPPDKPQNRDEVFVDERRGTPTIRLLLGDHERRGLRRTARYERGSGTDALTFEYAVGAGDGRVSAVEVEADSLARNGATIRNEDGYDVELHHVDVLWYSPLALLVRDAAAREGGTLKFAMELARASKAPVTVDYETADGTATAGEDYTAKRGTVTFAPGRTRKTVAVPVLRDEEAEDAETVVLRLSNARAGGSKAPVEVTVAQAEGTIEDVAPEAASGGLTARFARAPAEHDGKAFTLRIAFSETIRMSGRRLRSDVVSVAGGRATKARAVNGRKDRWDLTVRPASLADVTVTLAAGAACDSPAAVCTADGKALSHTLSTTVRGPVTVSVADARAREGEDETIDFAVSLSRAASGRVSVTWATADGTARAGSDYTRASGKLRFAPGETEKTISVPVLDDAHDEGAETMRLRLTAASGAAIADGVATGTIENSDPMPHAWLSRFGRTLAGQVVDALGRRMEGGGAGTHVRVGGMRFDASGAFVEAGDEDEPRLATDTIGWTDPADASSGMTGRELLLGSSFALGAGGADGTPAWTGWGRFATHGFEADVDGTRMDGHVTTGFVGADMARDGWLAGIALSYSTGDGDFSLIEGDDEGSVENSLTALYPYAKLGLGKKVDVWGLAGLGSGDLTLTLNADADRATDERYTTDIDMRMGALGVRGEVVSPKAPGGFAVNVKSDAFWVRMDSDAIASEDGNLHASQTDASRVRLVLEGSRAVELDEGTLTPSLKLGLRHDGGDAETGTGLEAGAGLRYAAGALTIGAQVRTLVAHEASGYEEWGVSGSVRLDPGASGRGLSLKLAPVWGAPSSGVEHLWSARDAGGLVGTEDFEAGRRLEAELGYGIALSGTKGLLTPYTALSWRQGGARTHRTGARWQLARAAAVDLEWTHEPGTGAKPPANALMLRTQVRW